MPPPPLRVVLDTTVLVSAFLTGGEVSAELLRLARLKRFTVILSEEILKETRQSLLSKSHIRKKYPYTDGDVAVYLTGLREACLLVAAPPIAVITQDPKDNPILACALAAPAKYLISRDPHLLGLQEYEGVTILTPEAYMGLLREEKSVKPPE
jgi:putative PIN family toxin of toxin-antitoxin system